MTQERVKKAIATLAAIIAALILAIKGGTVTVPTWLPGWLGFAGTVLGILGASPIGRVVGTREVRVPVKAAAPLLDTSALKKPPSPTSEEITSDDRPSGKLPR